MTWNWPQIAMITIHLLGIWLHAQKHGHPRTGTYDVRFALIGTAIAFTLLWFGGFWHGGAQ